MARALRNAARAAGLQPGDPMAPLVEALACTIVFLGQQRAAMAVMAEEAAERLGTILVDGRAAADAEAERCRAKCRLAEAERVGSFSIVPDGAAERAPAHRGRALDRRAATLAGLAVAGALALGATGGWWARERSARASITATEDGVRAALREGPATAAQWVALMRWNNPGPDLSACLQPGGILMHGGRRYCRIPLWIEPPAAGRP